MTASCDGSCIVKIAIAWSFEGHGKWIRGDWTLIENVETMGTKQRKKKPSISINTGVTDKANIFGFEG